QNRPENQPRRELNRVQSIFFSTLLELDNAPFRCALFLRVDLRNANLRGAIFYQADLSGAKLNGADITNGEVDAADLSDADISRVRFCGKHITGLNVTSIRSEKN